MTALVDIQSQRFDRLLVIARDTKGPPGSWWCCCDCGRVLSVRGITLRSGGKKSCGCLRHGRSRTAAYRVWAKMKERCSNPRHPHFHRYGGRGISVCDRWGSFELFYADMGDPPVGHQLDRRENDRGYSPDNCRWVTCQANNRNKSTNKWVTWDGQTKTVAEWSDVTGIPYMTLAARIRNGWDLDRAMTKKVVR